MRGISRGRGRGTADLFASDEPVPAPRLPAAEEIDQLRRQYAVLGFLCDRHPMALFEPQLRNEGLVKARDLHRHVGRRVRCAGCLVTAKLVPTRKGEPMEFVTFEDETGLMETTFFPEAYRRFGDMLDWHQPFVLWAVVEQDFGAITLTVNRVQRLSRRTASRCA
jgi:DNA polymerase-3 subunit alpha/error-prone DNA polymerase